MDMMPLIDFAFSLLVYFMMTYNADAGKLSSIVVNLPSAAKAQEFHDTDLTVSINNKNEIFINDAKHDPETLLEEFKKIKPALKQGTVIIRGDKKADYNTIINVIDDLNQAGIKKFTLSTLRLW
jgi:biopolymer transport protein ExbD